MEKKFKCQSCGTEFMADTNKYVTCPNCDSDNVALVGSKSPVVKILIIVFAALIVIGGAIVAILKFKDLSSDSDVSTQAIPVIEPIADPDTPAPYEEPIIPITYDEVAIIFSSIDTPIYDKTTDSYSIKVKAEVQGPNAANYTVNYKVTDVDGDKVLASNDNGKFTGLKPITPDTTNPEACYLFKAYAMKGNECVDSVLTIAPGFKVKPRTLVEKMSVAEVQALIDNKVSASVITNNPHLATNVRIRCKGDTGGEPAPNNLTGLIRHIKMPNNWTGAHVESLEYDDNNCVTCIVITPVLSND